MQGAFTELSRQLGIDVKLLKENVPRLFAGGRRPLMRAISKNHAAFGEGLRGRGPRCKPLRSREIRRRSPPVVRAFKLAGLAAYRNNQYDTALNHSGAAEKLRTRNGTPSNGQRSRRHRVLLGRQGHYARRRTSCNR